MGGELSSWGKGRKERWWLDGVSVPSAGREMSSAAGGQWCWCFDRFRKVHVRAVGRVWINQNKSESELFLTPNNGASLLLSFLFHVCLLTRAGTSRLEQSYLHSPLWAAGVLRGEVGVKGAGWRSSSLQGVLRSTTTISETSAQKPFGKL